MNGTANAGASHENKIKSSQLGQETAAAAEAAATTTTIEVYDRHAASASVSVCGSICKLLGGSEAKLRNYVARSLVNTVLGVCG